MNHTYRGVPMRAGEPTSRPPEPLLALFDKIKLGSKAGGDGAAESGPPAEGGAPGGADGFTADGAKAAKFFDRARSVHDTTNYEYATTLWLQGLRQDPTSMAGLEGFAQSAQSFAQTEKRDKPSKDQTSNFGGKGTLEKYLEQLLWWGMRPSDGSLGLKVVESAARLGLSEAGYYLGMRTLGALTATKPKKSELLTLMRSLQKLQAFDLAVRAGEAASALDPNDASLQAEVRNLAAQNTMSRGGYEKSGAAGGFRANIKDLEAQRRLIEEDKVVKSESAVDRLIAAAKEDYESRPSDRAAIAKYAAALRDRARPEDDKAAFDLLTKAYAETQEFRFRQQAGEIQLKHARRKLAKYKQEADANPGDARAAETHKKAHEAFLRKELEELRLRVENYPTDTGLKLELGVRHFLLGEDESAIALFQEARNDPKNRGRALAYLGQSFLRMGWADEAVDSLRTALAALETQNDETGLDVRYNLMNALERKARDHREAGAAEEAYKIASSIAMQQINYRDIRARRDDLQKLSREIKAGG